MVVRQLSIASSLYVAENNGYYAMADLGSGMAIPWKMLEAAGLSRENLGLNFQMNQKDITTHAPSYPGGIEAIRSDEGMREPRL